MAEHPDRWGLTGAADDTLAADTAATLLLDDAETYTVEDALDGECHDCAGITEHGWVVRTAGRFYCSLRCLACAAGLTAAQQLGARHTSTIDGPWFDGQEVSHDG